MTIVFHVRLNVSFIEIKTTSEKKFRRTNEGSKFVKGSFFNRDNVRERKSQHPKRYLSSRTDPSIFTSVSKQLF